ncbi:MAG: phosphoglycerate kinase [Planctomycetota bacterium]|nr:phosphoglycerate kinase [Planctomycetota bacterium]MCB9900412.1 phosphoglycerate kinase [Planctomycetota bacterium]
MPQLHADTFARALRLAAGYDKARATIEERLAAIPTAESLSDLPPGTPVWIRADLDVADVDGVIGDDPRLKSLHETLELGRRQGWRMLVFGHRGRDADSTLEYVYQRLRDLEPGAGPFIRDWFDEHAETLTGIAVKGVESLKPGQFLVLENVRRYDFERRLWTTTEEQLPQLTAQFARVATAMRQGGTVYLNDAIASGNKDFSTTAMPLAMGRVALGVFSRRELAEHVVRAREAGLVCFSGMKLDKLKQLHGVVARGRVELILAGGGLAMALLKASAERDGRRISIGAAGDPAQREAKAYVPATAVEQARKLLATAEERGVRVVLPVDFVLDDGRVADEIPPDAWQRDIGPKTRQLFHDEALAWAGSTKRRVAFHNGVMGQFENRAFAAGTESLVETLKALHAAGVAVYVGGGEGRAALERYGSLGDVTHAFTAGGTILKCLADEPLPFLEALAAQASGQD